MSYNYNSPYGMGYQYPQNTMQVGNYQQTNYQSSSGNFAPKTITYTSEEEIKALILAPNSQVMAIDREKPYFYIKSCDSLGRSTVDVFKFEKVNESKEKLAEVNYLTKEDLKGFVSKEEFDGFMKKCEDLTRLLKVNKDEEGK